MLLLVPVSTMAQGDGDDDFEGGSKGTTMEEEVVEVAAAAGGRYTRIVALGS